MQPGPWQHVGSLSSAPELLDAIQAHLRPLPLPEQLRQQQPPAGTGAMGGTARAGQLAAAEAAAGGPRAGAEGAAAVAGSENHAATVGAAALAAAGQVLYSVREVEGVCRLLDPRWVAGRGGQCVSAWMRS